MNRISFELRARFPYLFGANISRMDRLKTIALIKSLVFLLMIDVCYLLNQRSILRSLLGSQPCCNFIGIEWGD